jgi:hypothetical protein
MIEASILDTSLKKDHGFASVVFSYFRFISVLMYSPSK